jgi:hypothetical protein
MGIKINFNKKAFELSEQKFMVNLTKVLCEITNKQSFNDYSIKVHLNKSMYTKIYYSQRLMDSDELDYYFEMGNRPQPKPKFTAYLAWGPVEIYKDTSLKNDQGYATISNTEGE